MARPRTSGADEAVIGPTTRVRGRVSGDGNLRIDGVLEGDVALRGDFVVSEGAKAASNVDAHGVTVSGELTGNVRAEGVVHLTANARVQGDIQGELVAIDDGAAYTGRLIADFELPPELGGAAPGRRR